MENVVIVVQVVSIVVLIVLVMLQQGRGADAGASFGAGASQTVFGSSGSGNFLARATSFVAAIFFLASITLGYMVKMSVRSDDALVPAAQEVPTVPANNADAPALPVKTSDTPEVPES